MLYTVLGMRENINGLVRQLFPKGIHFRLATPREVAAVQAELNESAAETTRIPYPKRNPQPNHVSDASNFTPPSSPAIDNYSIIQ